MQQLHLLHRAVCEDKGTGRARRAWRAGRAGRAGRNNKGKAAPAAAAQSHRWKPGKLCEEQLLQLEVQDNLQKEQKAYSKGGLIFRENWEKTCSQKSWLMIIFTWKYMATTRCRMKGRSYKETRWNGLMSFQPNGILGFLKEWLDNLHESLYRNAGFMMWCGQLKRSIKGDLSSRLGSNHVSCGKNKKGKGVNSWTNIIIFIIIYGFPNSKMNSWSGRYPVNQTTTKHSRSLGKRRMRWYASWINQTGTILTQVG